MVHYFAYDPTDLHPVEDERHVIDNGMIRLRHVPVENSIKIDGFTEVNSPAGLQRNEFACLYSRETNYRESNRLLYFSTAHNNTVVEVSYKTCGTPFTADDANEIKAHIDAGAIQLAQNEAAHTKFHNDILDLQSAVATISAAQGGGSSYVLPTASKTVKGGVKIGNGLEMADDTLNVTISGGDGDQFFHFHYVDCGSYGVNGYGATVAEICDGFDFEDAFREQVGRDSKLGDVALVYYPGNSWIYFFRTQIEWVLLGNSFLDRDSWNCINPLLSTADRIKLDGLENYSLPAASASSLGGVKVGSGLEIVDGVLNCTINAAELDIASDEDINNIINNIFGGN